MKDDRRGARPPTYSTGRPLPSLSVLGHSVRMRVRPEWYRVGQYMIARRTVDLGIPNREDWSAYVAKVTGHTISSKTIGKIERGQTFGSPQTRAALEAALGWMPGSCDEIAAGREPILREPPAGAEESGSDDINEEMLAHLREQRHVVLDMEATDEESEEYLELLKRMWHHKEPDLGRFRRTVERFADEVAQEPSRIAERRQSHGPG